MTSAAGGIRVPPGAHIRLVILFAPAPGPGRTKRHFRGRPLVERRKGDGGEESTYVEGTDMPRLEGGGVVIAMCSGRGDNMHGATATELNYFGKGGGRSKPPRGCRTQDIAPATTCHLLPPTQQACSRPRDCFEEGTTTRSPFRDALDSCLKSQGAKVPHQQLPAPSSQPELPRERGRALTPGRNVSFTRKLLDACPTDSFDWSLRTGANRKRDGGRNARFARAASKYST